MGDTVEVSAESIAKKLDKAGLTDDEQAVLSKLLTAALTEEVSGFTFGQDVAKGLGAGIDGVGGGAYGAAGVAAGAAGGTAKYGLHSLHSLVGNLKGTSVHLDGTSGSLSLKIV